MREIDAHTIKVLEFPKITELIRGLTLSPFGQIRAENLRPLFDRDEIILRLRQSSQMREIIRFEEAIPLIRIEDITELIEKSRVEGLNLEPKSLLRIKLFLDTVCDLVIYGKAEDRNEKFPDIVNIIKEFHPKREIAAAIGKAIDSSGEILDKASSALAKIRRDINDSAAKIKNHLNKILSSRKKHTGWQDDVITIRDGRFVIPVLSSDFKQTKGIIHDKSHSGATLYVEPDSAIPINNKLRQLQQDEKIEISRILRELTAMVGQSAEDIACDIDIYGRLDFIHACAGFALKIESDSPDIFDQGELNLIDARHPLLIYTAESSDDIIPLSITLDKDNQGILMTGPNTGGKTVAIKTIGLLTLMAMSGLEIPANPKSQIGIYGKIFADIGDEQSLELSLSTFSSHIRNIIAAINEADKNTLVLFDEIGAGTDPKEGAALAEVIILTLLELGCNILATTHYSQLKTLPLEYPGLINASLEFDRKNLKPTFRLKLGIPGASYAIDIARRLGLPDEMADKSAELLGTRTRSLDKLIEKLDTDLEHVRKERAELDERLAKAKILEEYYLARKNHLDDKEKEFAEKQIKELEKQIENGRREIDKLVKSIRESQADSKQVKKSHKFLKNRSKEIADQKQKLRSKKLQDAKILSPGETVWIDKFNTEGEVIEMLDHKRAKVIIGNATMIVDTIDVTRQNKNSDDPKKKKVKPYGLVNASVKSDFRPEIMLRGMTVEEALESLDKFLDDAIIAGLAQVYIIHGKGTGILRKNLTAYLNNHSAVESLRIGNWNEGGHGVTIARLKT
ncbi:MAG: endonuclease MutS2 [candidate division Zixibacteria bacterium]